MMPKSLICLQIARSWLFLGAILFPFGGLARAAGVKDGVVDPAFEVNAITLADMRARLECVVPLPDGRIAVSGVNYLLSGLRSGSVSILHSDGSLDTSFRGRTDSLVSDIFPLPNGQFLISGDFIAYDGVARNRIARINADGSIDPSFNPDFGTDYVQINTVQPDGRIIVVGDFLNVGGVPRNRIARLHPDGSLDSSFQVGAGLNNAGVDKGAIQPDGKILLVGRFDSYDGVARDGLLRLNSDGSLDTGFVPNHFGGGSEFVDLSLRPDGKLYVAGYQFGYRVYRFNADGAVDWSFLPKSTSATGGRVFSVFSQPDGKVLIGGDFDGFFINGNLRNQRGLIRFLGDGTLDTAFATQTDGSEGGIRAIAMHSSRQLILGGDYNGLNGWIRGGIARMNLGGAVDLSFLGFLGYPTHVDNFYLFPDARILLTGAFDTLSTYFSNYAAILNADGLPDTSFTIDPAIDNRVTANAVQPDGKIILGIETIWRVNPNGSLDQTFNTAETDAGSIVAGIAIQNDGKILIAGNFSNVNGTQRRALARLNSNGSLDTTFVPTVGGSTVSAVLIQPDGKILVGGSFSTFNGAPTANIARLNPDGSSDSSFVVGTGANQQVWSLLLSPDGRIYAGGSFSSFNGVSRRSLVRLLPTGSLDPTFKSPRINGAVYSIASAPAGKILIGGTCDSTADAASRQRLLRLLNDGSVDFSFDVSGVTRNTTSGEVYQVDVLSDNKILATGQFDKVNGVQRTGLARFLTFANPTRPYFDYDGDGITDISVFRSANGTWFRRRSSVNAARITPFGQNGDRIVPADYDGDYRTDIAVFRPDTGFWYVLNSSDDTVTYQQFGVADDLPAPGDYDGDGKADLTVFRPSQGTWYRQNSSNGSFFGMQFGATGDVPTVGDFDGDGKNDLGIWRPSNGDWYNIRSSNGSVFGERFGQTGDKIAPADYDGDGKTDIAIFRPSTGLWVVRNSATATYSYSVFGAPSDVPISGDYDGDGKADIGVWRPSDGTWYIQRSDNGQFIVFPWGQNGDRPTPSAYGN